MNDYPNREVAVFNAALELTAAERPAFLRAECAGDAELQQRVERLLAANERAGNFLNDQNRPGASHFMTGHGDRVGHYKLLQQIGEGGCGVVYMAEQEAPVRRRVALKVIKLGMDTRQVIARFEAERQALALMDHPNIARIFDAGVTEGGARHSVRAGFAQSEIGAPQTDAPHLFPGRPYFVMELVRGVKITDYCNENNLSTETRLKLFIQVCHAIQHAHQKGVIHRDIKPSNILVTVNDGVPVPKVIDFGIAKATQGRLTDQTLFTAFEQFIGTPAYMSPEQAVLTSVEVDTRSDIYSLGVLLYELLTGQTPFAQKDLLASGLDEMRRTIREVEPVKPSTRLTLELAAADVRRRKDRSEFQNPKSENESAWSPRRLQELIHLVRGDLDWIVMKCLQKERARRYETVNALAMDITRHLRHEPVLARPDSQAYRMTKFVRRHRASAAFAALVLVALSGGLLGTLTQARRATQHAREADAQRDFALRQLQRAETINDLNTFLLSDAAPHGGRFTVRELLQRAEQVVASQPGDADENRVELFIAIGHQYENLDEHGKSRELLGKAYALSRKLSEPSIRAKAAAALSVSIALAGEYDRGEALIQEALRELGNAPQFVLHRVFALLRGSRVARESGKEQLGIERALAADRLVRESGQSSPLLDLTVAMEIAEAYRMAEMNREAATAFEEAFKYLSALGRGDTEKAGTLLNNWAVAVESLGLPLEAERLYRRALEIGSADGADEGVSPMLLNNLARTLNDLHRYDEAARYAEAAFEKAQRAGDEHVVNMALNVRVSTYRQQGKFDLADEMLREFEAKSKQLLPPDHVVFAIIASQKAMLALARGDGAAALADANRSISMAEGTPMARMPFLLWRRAQVQLKGGRFDAALADARRALTLNQEAVGSGNPSSWSGMAQLTVARALQGQGKVAEARAAYVTALEHLRPALGEEHPETRAAAKAIADL